MRDSVSYFRDTSRPGCLFCVVNNSDLDFSIFFHDRLFFIYILSLYFMLALCVLRIYLAGGTNIN